MVVLVWVLVGCLSAAVAEDPNLSSLYPPFWEDITGQLSGFDLEDGKYIINPWEFTDRMKLYKILLNKTAPYFAKYGPENEQNLLWGLPLQFGWQYTTGRLSDPTGKTTCGYEILDELCVSVNSWWADVNYFLSVLPFLAAVDSGILGISSDEFRISLPPLDESRFCYNVSDCKELVGETMDSWSTFFEYMQLPSSDFDGLLKHLWAAHTSSLEYPVSAFEDRYAYYSKQEVKFEENWSIAVEYIAAAYFPTTLNRTNSFQKGLPPRLLYDTDIAPLIANFTSLQNQVLLSLTALGDIHKLTGSSSLTAWKILMSTKFAREQFLKAFEAYLGAPTSDFNF
ncbi:protein LEG1 homolog [Phodopus roborovskii]|uniref:2310057J18Rik protein n=1 Tax=Phodopus roborovskii TaxID=109678 RepID=A0AAU9YSY5_PHORO|nr:protein LEG1 homolog [Phodopus roborovskii]CAH6778163.1 2310057J18Rik [Phodopus roborovskii]